MLRLHIMGTFTYMCVCVCVYQEICAVLGSKRFCSRPHTWLRLCNLCKPWAFRCPQGSPLSVRACFHVTSSEEAWCGSPTAGVCHVITSYKLQGIKRHATKALLRVTVKSKLKRTRRTLSLGTTHSLCTYTRPPGAPHPQAHSLTLAGSPSVTVTLRDRHPLRAASRGAQRAHVLT